MLPHPSWVLGWARLGLAWIWLGVALLHTLEWDLCLAWLSSALALLGLTLQPGPGLVLSLALLHSLDWDLCSDRLGLAWLWLGLALLHSLDRDLCSDRLGLAWLWLGLALLHSLDRERCLAQRGLARGRIGFTPQPSLGPGLGLAWLNSKALPWLGLCGLGLAQAWLRRDRAAMFTSEICPRLEQEACHHYPSINYASFVC